MFNQDITLITEQVNNNTKVYEVKHYKAYIGVEKAVVNSNGTSTSSNRTVVVMPYVDYAFRKNARVIKGYITDTFTSYTNILEKGYECYTVKEIHINDFNSSMANIKLVC